MTFLWCCGSRYGVDFRSMEPWQCPRCASWWLVVKVVKPELLGVAKRLLVEEDEALQERAP